MAHKIENPTLEKKCRKKWQQDADLREEFTLDDTDEEGFSRFFAYMDAQDRELINPLYYMATTDAGGKRVYDKRLPPIEKFVEFANTPVCRDHPLYKSLNTKHRGKRGGTRKIGFTNELKATIQHIHDKLNLEHLKTSEESKIIIDLFKDQCRGFDYDSYVDLYSCENKEICPIKNIKFISDDHGNDIKFSFELTSSNKETTKSICRISNIIREIRKK